MRYTITEEDKLLFSQGSLDYKYRFSVMKGSQIVDVLYGVSQAGTYGIKRRIRYPAHTEFYTDPGRIPYKYRRKNTELVRTGFQI